MGNCNFKTESETDSVAGNSNSFPLLIATNKNHFMFHYVIGRGGFGKVWKVEKKKEKKLFAMKEMHKGRIITKRSVNSVMNEKKFLTQLNHP
jgi:serine/threonine protein kinase